MLDRSGEDALWDRFFLAGTGAASDRSDRFVDRFDKMKTGYRSIALPLICNTARLLTYFVEPGSNSTLALLNQRLCREYFHEFSRHIKKIARSAKCLCTEVEPSSKVSALKKNLKI